MTALLIDHAPHDGTRAIGSQHKRSAVTGASYLFTRRGVLRPGRHGKVDVKILKDRPGSVRRVSAGGEKVGTMHVADMPDRPAHTEIFLEAPGTLNVQPKGDMERVSIWLEQNADAARRAVVRGAGGDQAANEVALDWLVAEGFASVREVPHGPRVWRYYTSMATYRA